MEINEKLQHLTEKQIEEVVAMYMDKSVKISDILSKYNIDVKPSGLLKILPPVRTNDVCVICGECLYKNIDARTAYSYKGEHSDKYCLSCGHKEYTNNVWGRKKCDSAYYSVLTMEYYDCSDGNDIAVACICYNMPLFIYEHVNVLYYTLGSCYNGDSCCYFVCRII